jgi:hypothetical protein
MSGMGSIRFWYAHRHNTVNPGHTDFINGDNGCAGRGPAVLEADKMPFKGFGSLGRPVPYLPLMPRPCSFGSSSRTRNEDSAAKS